MPGNLHFFDVGSNIGQTFEDYIHGRADLQGAHVWLFEPSPRNLPALLEKAQAQSARYRIHVCPFGLHGENAVWPFYQKDGDCRGDSFESQLASDYQPANLSVGYRLLAPAVDVVEFLDRHIPANDRVVLKLDCEGAEYFILDALCRRLPHDPRLAEVLVEWHTIGSDHLSVEETTARWSAHQSAPMHRWMF